MELLEADKFQLILGQVASEVESKIAHRVLDNILGTYHDTKNVSSMDKALKYILPYDAVFETEDQLTIRSAQSKICKVVSSQCIFQPFQ